MGSISARPALLAPEVLQTSAMDCGPAALKCLLAAAGVEVSYPRLRELCHTSLDGSSIDVLEEVAGRLGAPCEQVMVPVPHLFEPETRAFPSLAVVRGGNGSTHFLVLWRALGPLVELMDPASGRRWCTRAQLEREIHVHEANVPPEAFAEWSRTDEFLLPLRRRLERLAPSAVGRIEQAKAEEGWRALARLESAVRRVEQLVRSGALGRGEPAAAALAAVEAGLSDGTLQSDDRQWTARAAGEQEEDGLWLSGAVLLRLKAATTDAPADATGDGPSLEQLREPPERAGRTLWRLVREGGRAGPLLLLTASVLASAAVVTEGLLFQAFLQLDRWLRPTEQRLDAIAGLLVFLVGVLLIELAAEGGFARLGRALELRFRSALLEKLPRLGDRYFRTRPASDLAERAHRVETVRRAPALTAQALRLVLQLGFTALAIAWLDPAAAKWALLAAASALLVPLAFSPALTERDLRMRTHAGSLSRYYLDAFLGLVPLRLHSAERSLRREHELTLSEWLRAGLSFQWLVGVIELLQGALGLSLAAAIVLGHVHRASLDGPVLLLAYWALNLPVLGQGFSQLVRHYPALRNITLRVLEPLGTPEENRALEGDGPELPDGAVAIGFDAVTVEVAGHPLLEEVSVELRAGEQVAIVGASGSGKSTLVGLLLGWHAPSRGRVTVSGAPLGPQRLAELRQHTVWIDPEVHLWNRTLLDNLTYGSSEVSGPKLSETVHQADLRNLIATLPQGLQTSLGEGGGLLSGGEGQRVRLGRGLHRERPKLVILDEAFRGLERARRGELLQRSRERWKGATLLCVSHDVGATQGFDRVLVVDQGRVVEDGAPSELAAREGSHYRALLEAEQTLLEHLADDGAWTRLELEHGRLGARRSG